MRENCFGSKGQREIEIRERAQVSRKPEPLQIKGT